MCEMSAPSVFSLVSLLENEETIKDALDNKNPMAFSYDQDLVPAELEEAEAEKKEDIDRQDTTVVLNQKITFGSSDVCSTVQMVIATHKIGGN